MKITIKCKPKEIADLALELQNRLKSEKVLLVRKPYSDEYTVISRPIFRRFKLLCQGEQKKAFLALVKQKGLTREDLILILRSVKLDQHSGST